MAHEQASATEAGGAGAPHASPPRTLSFLDLLLFYIVSVISIRWVATAATAGPSAIVIWLIAAVAFFIPLAFSVIELSSRYPQEGGIYVWTREQFGNFAGFICGWFYWTSNLPYFPSLLYFAAGNALYMGGPAWQGLANRSSYFITFSVAALALALVVNLVGLNIGKWLNNLGALGTWSAVVLVIVAGLIAWWRFGSATPFSPLALRPSTHLSDISFWAAIAFAFGGLECASLMGDEIQNARRTIPRALLLAGGLIAAAYIGGTVALLLAIPPEQVSEIQGLMQAIESTARRAGIAGVGGLAAALITLGTIGTAGAWLAAIARLPFVAGVDAYLPASFARLHPRWRTPHIALLAQAGFATLFVLIGQLGTTVRGAYEVLVNMAVIAFFIPFAFIFLAILKVQHAPLPEGAIGVPGGRLVAYLAGSVGLLSTLITIFVSLLPPPGEPHKIVATFKIGGVTLALFAIGCWLYSRRRHKTA